MDGSLTLLANVGITVAIAIGIAALQTIMRHLSRTDLPNRRTGLTLEDGLFFTDWTIAGLFAIVAFYAAALDKAAALRAAAEESGTSEPGVQNVAPQVREVEVAGVNLWLVACLILAVFVFPAFLRLVAYDDGAKLKRLAPRGLGWVLIANAAGMLVLAAAVLTGAERLWNPMKNATIRQISKLHGQRPEQRVDRSQWLEELRRR